MVGSSHFFRGALKDQEWTSFVTFSAQPEGQWMLRSTASRWRPDEYSLGCCRNIDYAVHGVCYLLHDYPPSPAVIDISGHDTGARIFSDRIWPLHIFCATRQYQSIRFG